MKVTVPYAPRGKMLEAVKVALFHERVPVDYRAMNGETDYYELFRELWRKGEPFIINEHDIVGWPGAIHELDKCPEPWCTFTYRAPCGWLSDGLGLVKFIPKLLPNIFADAFSNKHWGGIDMQIARRLNGAGLKPHVHSPAVTNLNLRMWWVAT